MKKSVVLIMVLALFFSFSIFAFAESVETADASTMRLARTEGSVSLKDEAGTELSFRENMRLYSGNTVETEADSRAGISLDETKSITLDEDSFVKLYQDGKKLRINLENGAMYFSVYQPLTIDEQFEIETSTMVLGIRGTSGYVETISQTVSKVILTSGHVVIKAASGEEYELYPGKCVIIERTPTGTDFEVSDIYPSGYPDFLTEELAADPFQFPSWDYAPSDNGGGSSFGWTGGRPSSGSGSGSQGSSGGTGGRSSTGSDSGSQGSSGGADSGSSSGSGSQGSSGGTGYKTSSGSGSLESPNAAGKTPVTRP